MRAGWTAFPAWWARRLGRTPSAVSWTWASQRGSMTSGHAGYPTRPRPVGIPPGRCPPSGVGLGPRRPGGGRSGPALRAGVMCSTHGSPPWRSPAALGTPAIPPAPPVARTAGQARPRISGRKLRSSNPGPRRFRLLVAAPSRLCGRARAWSLGGGGPCRAGPVTDLRPRRGRRRGPTRPARGVVSRIGRTVASSDVSPNVPRDVAFRRRPAVTAEVDRRSAEPSPVPSPPRTASRSPDAGGCSGTAPQDLGAFHGRRRACAARLPLGPGRAPISPRPDARQATGGSGAPLPPGATPRPPRPSPARPERLRRGLLRVTTTAPAPVRRR